MDSLPRYLQQQWQIRTLRFQNISWKSYVLFKYCRARTVYTETHSCTSSHGKTVRQRYISARMLFLKSSEYTPISNAKTSASAGPRGFLKQVNIGASRRLKRTRAVASNVLLVYAAWHTRLSLAGGYPARIEHFCFGAPATVKPDFWKFSQFVSWTRDDVLWNEQCPPL